MIFLTSKWCKEHETCETFETFKYRNKTAIIVDCGQTVKIMAVWRMKIIKHSNVEHMSFFCGCFWPMNHL